MKQDLVDVLLKNILDAIEAPETPKTPKKSNISYSDAITVLLSHPGFQQFMDGDIEDSEFISVFIEGATPFLQIFDIASDEQLQYLPSAPKEKIIPYLEKLKAVYAKAVDNIIARITGPIPERSLEDLSKEELLEYIQSHLQ